MQGLTPEQRQQAIRGMVEGLDARLRDSPADRDGWLQARARAQVLGENRQGGRGVRQADAIAPLDPRQLADWAEAQVRQLQPAAPPSPEAVSVLERLEKAEPRNALALFYLGAADFARGDKPAAARRWKTLLAMLPRTRRSGRCSKPGSRRRNRRDLWRRPGARAPGRRRVQWRRCRA
jgi:cytochrome c-type biogenesis protein CcmH